MLAVIALFLSGGAGAIVSDCSPADTCDMRVSAATHSRVLAGASKECCTLAGSREVGRETAIPPPVPPAGGTSEVVTEGHRTVTRDPCPQATALDIDPLLSGPPLYRLHSALLI